MDEESLKKARNRLAAGRIKAIEKAPYLATAMLSLTPHEMIGFGTFAVDDKWILYYDPKMCLAWSVDEIAAVWIHEINHVIRDHAGRFAATGDSATKAPLFNVSADAAINSDLRDMGVVLPDPDKRWYAEKNPVYPQWRRNMTAEEMYVIAKKGRKDDDEEKGKGPKDSEDSSDESKDQEENEEDQDSSSNDENQEKSKDDSENEESENDESQENDSENDESSEETDSSDSKDKKPDSSDEKENEESDGDKSESEDKSDSDSSEDSESSEDSDDHADSDSQSQSSDSSESPESDSKDSEEESDSTGADKHANCGSGAHGIPQDYELDDGTGYDPLEAEQMRRDIAREIDSYSERYGTVPGGLLREAKNILDPQVDWEDELMSVVRKEIANITGQSDYSYARPSRRNSQTEFILPSMRQAPPPEIVIILDTSGSMNVQKELAQALGEMEDLIDRAARHSALGGIRIINCDAGANIPVIVSDLNDFEIIGGGGTDMRIGIQAAAELLPKAGIIITMTDGFTPWPREIPEDNEDALYIALIIDSSKGKNTNKRGWSTTGIPEWLQVIEVNIK